MGTHPIFESDFDCLTESSNRTNHAKSETSFDCFLFYAANISTNWIENSSTQAANVTQKSSGDETGSGVSNKERNLAIGLCCALGVLIISIIVYWIVHRKRKRRRLEEEEKPIESISEEQLPHATYLQTLMTLAGETLSRANNNETVPDVRSIFESVTTNNDESVNSTQEQEQLERIDEHNDDDDVFEAPSIVVTPSTPPVRPAAQHENRFQIKPI